MRLLAQPEQTFENVEKIVNLGDLTNNQLTALRLLAQPEQTFENVEQIVNLGDLTDKQLTALSLLAQPEQTFENLQHLQRSETENHSIHKLAQYYFNTIYDAVFTQTPTGEVQQDDKDTL